MRSLHDAARAGDLKRVQELVEQGAEMENIFGISERTPLLTASFNGHFEVVRYLLEQGADRDKASVNGMTSLHWAAITGQLEISKLLMVYGASLIAKDNFSQLPIDRAINEEMKQAIRDEPRRRLDHGLKRATEHGPCKKEDEEEEEQSKKQSAEEVADEDQDSELSSDEEDD